MGISLTILLYHHCPASDSTWCQNELILNNVRIVELIRMIKNVHQKSKRMPVKPTIRFRDPNCRFTFEFEKGYNETQKIRFQHCLAPFRQDLVADLMALTVPAAQKRNPVDQCRTGFHPPGYADCIAVVCAKVLSVLLHASLWSNWSSLTVLPKRY